MIDCYAYSGYGCQLLSSVTNALGQATTLDQYDANRRLLRHRRVARTTSFGYDAAGKLLTAALPGRGTLTYAKALGIPGRSPF